MIFEMRRAKNGYVLKVTDPEAKDFGEEEVVCQEEYSDDEGNEVERFADFLRYLSDHYGPTTSRYSPKRIYIRVAPGDKHEDWKESDE